MPQGALDGVQLHLVTSLAGLDACRRWVSERRETPLFADTESGGLNPYKHRHRMTQLGDMRHGWAFPPAWAGAAVELLTTYRGQVGFHNAPYDLRVLAVHQNVNPDWFWHRTDDTLLNGHIADSLRLAGLKERATQEVDSRAKRAEDILKEGMRARHWGYDDVPDTWEPYWRYAALDPVLSAHLWNLRSFRQARNLYAQAYDLERATARICVNMMMAGMAIDEPFIRARISEITEYTDRAGNWLHREFGIGNVRSGAQVVAAMQAAGIRTTVLTEKGRASINKEALKYYRIAYPEHTGLLNAIEWSRKGDKLVGSYLQKFLDLANDGIMHYNIHSCKARTSRMSITDPPMQTFDRDVPAVRGSFRPREGHVFITIDADQIEARLAAHFSGDQRMIEDFRYADANNLKFFIEMASRIYAERISKKDPRYTWTKNATYGQIYGAGLDKAAVTAGVPIETMRPAYEGLASMYPGVNHLMNRLIASARNQRPKVQILDGRWLYTYRGKEYALLNTLIQGSAAVIMKRGLVNLDAAGLGPYLRLVAHDEAMLEVPREMADDVLREAERILTDRESFAVPITWSGSILTERWVKT